MNRLYTKEISACIDCPYRDRWESHGTHKGYICTKEQRVITGDCYVNSPIPDWCGLSKVEEPEAKKSPYTLTVETLEEYLHKLYHDPHHAKITIAAICDGYLDRSGAMLCRIRKPLEND